MRMTGLEVNPSPSPGLSSEARHRLSNNGIDWDGTPASIASRDARGRRFRGGHDPQHDPLSHRGDALT